MILKMLASSSSRSIFQKFFYSISPHDTTAIIHTSLITWLYGVEHTTLNYHSPPTRPQMKKDSQREHTSPALKKKNISTTNHDGRTKKHNSQPYGVKLAKRNANPLHPHSSIAHFPFTKHILWTNLRTHHLYYQSRRSHVNTFPNLSHDPIIFQ